MPRESRVLLKLAAPTPRGCGLLAALDLGAVAWWASPQASLVEDLQPKRGAPSHISPAWRSSVTRWWTTECP